MHWEFLVALVLAIPVVLFPVAFVWYLNIGGVSAMVREARKRQAAREHERTATAEQQPAKY